MSFGDQRILVTGGAGFVGSHLVDAFMGRGAYVTVLDNLSTGSKENVRQWIGHSRFSLEAADCLEAEDLRRAMKDRELVFHAAANPEVRAALIDPEIDFQQNVAATKMVLEEMRKSRTARILAFTSTSTVYGEAKQLPTPEDYGPLTPISLYGASKLACEALISGYCHMFGLRSVIYRFANIVGSRSRHGVVWDFIQKLRKNPKELEILGDGRQSKSYLLVDDCVEAFLIGLKKLPEKIETYNVGSSTRVSVIEVAKIVSDEMNLKDVSLTFTGGVEGGRGWKGDVKTMLLDTSKIEKLGWRSKHDSAESVRIAARQLLRKT
ncbi:MAG: NAD-dependent epimerase/dehydratase family protein [Aigarchaeota archaeon]|nr:NAD-dependent epimerase/dehydratase family protein [Aigarchaeota archaeon]